MVVELDLEGGPVMRVEERMVLNRLVEEAFPLISEAGG